MAPNLKTEETESLDYISGQSVTPYSLENSLHLPAPPPPPLQRVMDPGNSIPLLFYFPIHADFSGNCWPAPQRGIWLGKVLEKLLHIGATSVNAHTSWICWPLTRQMFQVIFLGRERVSVQDATGTFGQLSDPCGSFPCSDVHLHKHSPCATTENFLASSTRR